MSTTQKHTYVALIAWVQGSSTATKLNISTNISYHNDLILQYIADNEHVKKYVFQASNDIEADYISESLFFKDNFTAGDSIYLLYTKEKFDEKVRSYNPEIYDYLVVLDDGDTYSGSLNSCKVVGVTRCGVEDVEIAMAADVLKKEDVLFEVTVGDLLDFYLKHKDKFKEV